MEMIFFIRMQSMACFLCESFSIALTWDVYHLNQQVCRGIPRPAVLLLCTVAALTTGDNYMIN
jgi:hypothetical protein